MKIYCVGGAVRDRILGKSSADRDWLVVGARPEDLLAQGFLPVGRDFPVFLHPTTREEYALARTERKTAGGYHGFVFHAAPDVTLEEDLRRRDLTINAMAEDENGNIIDLFGGRADLSAGILRHVSEAFCEDPVRILRTARFAARFDFALAPETLHLMQQMVAAGELDFLVAERVWQECARALMEKKPSHFFRVLRASGALQKVMPEVDALFGVPQSPQSHPEIDCGEHMLLVLDQTANAHLSLEARFAAVAHDLGKALTPKEVLPKHPHHENAGLTALKTLAARLKLPASVRDFAYLATQWHGALHRAEQLSSEEIAQVLQACDALRRPERFAELLRFGQADSRGRLGFEHAEYPQQQFWQGALQTLQQLDIQALIQNIAPQHRATAITQAKVQALDIFLKQNF